MELAIEPNFKPIQASSEILKIFYNAPEFRVEPKLEEHDLVVVRTEHAVVLPVGESGKPVPLILPFAPARIFYTDGRTTSRLTSTLVNLKVQYIAPKINCTQ